MGVIRRAARAAVARSALVLLACSSPTAPGEVVFLEGRLSPAGAETHLVALPRSGATTIDIEDLRKVLWDVTLGDVVPSVVLGIGRAIAGECEVTGQLSVGEGDVYLWSLQEGEHCFVLSDPGTIPMDGVLAYVVRLDLPG